MQYAANQKLLVMWSRLWLRKIRSWEKSILSALNMPYPNGTIIGAERVLLTEAVLQRLEMLGFAVIAPEFWKSYADGTFVIIKKDLVPSFH